MSKRTHSVALGLLSVLVGAGCAQRFGRDSRLRLVERAPADLSAATAPFRGQAIRLRQSVILSVQGREQLLSGLLVLDPEAGTAQLLASPALGPVLLALSVSADGHTLLRPAPPPYDSPYLAAGVAASVRRMFLAGPLPLETTFRRGWRVYQGWSGVGPEAQRYRLDREPLVLLEVAGQSAKGPWRVTYGSYRQTPVGLLPMALVYEEPANRLRVTVWNESVER